MSAKTDPIAVLEAAYRVDADEETWLGGLLAAAQATFDRGDGALAMTIDGARVGTLDGVGVVVSCGPVAPDLRQLVVQAHAVPAPELFRAVYMEGDAFGLFSQKTRGLTTAPPGRSTPDAIGMIDGVGLAAMNPTGRGVCITGVIREPFDIKRRDVAMWSRVAAHIATAHRLREARAGAPEAVLTPGGRVDHAEEAAKSKSARDALSTLARGIDRARAKLRRSDPEEATAIWHALAAGRWSLTDHFDHDGRRYLVARRNEPEARAWQNLTTRERQVVAYAAMGHSNKHIAYELGLAPSSIAICLSRAARKVGARSRVELIAAYNRT
jgi:DNA-binding NarL/FixJ family response regulator